MKKTSTAIDWGAETVNALRRHTMTMGGGIESLFNEQGFRRGQIIRFVGANGVEQKGYYVMASSAADYVVLSLGGRYGIPKVVPLSAILTKPKA